MRESIPPERIGGKAPIGATTNIINRSIMCFVNFARSGIIVSGIKLGGGNHGGIRICFISNDRWCTNDAG
jgi:hypothetical protein